MACFRFVCQAASLLAASHAAATDLEAEQHTLSISTDRVVAHTSSAVVYSHGELDLRVGPHLVLLRNLSSPEFSNRSLEEQSLQVNLEGGSSLIERIVWDNVPLATKEELDVLESDIEKVVTQLDRLDEKVALSKSRLKALETFETNLVHPSPELVQKGEDIVKILKKSFAARVEADEHIHALKEQRRSLNQQLSELKGQLRQASQPQRVAKLYISVVEAGRVTFRLQRIVASVMWRPRYEIYVNSTSGLVTMVYDALVHQQSGHPWDNVLMELCTGAPSTDRRLPSLSPWFISSSKAHAEHHRGMSFQSYSSYEKKRKVAARSSNAYSSSLESALDDGEMRHEFEDDSEDADSDESDAHGGSFVASEVVSSGVSEVFVLPKRQTIPASQDIRVHISSVALKANLSYTAVPKRSTKVYVRAEVRNDSPFTLLAGSSLVFVDGSFVGSSHVNLIPTHGHADLDAGIDNGLRVTRKIISDETTTTGGVLSGRTKTKVMKYELVLKSMRSFGVTVRVLDQVPLPQSEDLKVHLIEPEVGAIRADHKPVQLSPNATLRAGGEVMWERYLQADSVLKIPFQFSIEFGAERHISNFEL